MTNAISKLIGLKTCGELMEAPQYYQGAFAYMTDDKFTRISMDNFRSYLLIDSDEAFTFVANEQLSMGYVFLNTDIEAEPKLGLIPVMRVQLRETNINGYKQAYRLRIRKQFSRNEIAKKWYTAYVAKFGGIVSDFEHLEGGMRLWRSFVRTASYKGLKITLINAVTGESKLVDENTPFESIWSKDSSLKSSVLVLEKP